MQDTNLTEQTVNQILEMIKKSQLKEGEFFATESQLEEQFRISRPVLREAISRIRTLGFLESRQRKGLIISRPDPIKLFEQVFRYGIIDALNIRELAELRYTIELGAIELSAKRATDEQIEKLEKLTEEFAESIKPEYAGRNQDEIELDFHRTILEATRNEMLTRMHSVLTAFFARAKVELPKWNEFENMEKGLWEHRAIAQALRERNAERARAILAGHLSGLIDNHNPNNT